MPKLLAKWTQNIYTTFPCITIPSSFPLPFLGEGKEIEHVEYVHKYRGWIHKAELT